MDDINRVILCGRMSKDAELKYTGAGMPVMNGNIAVTKSRKIEDTWTEEGHFFNFRLWGAMAEKVAKYCTRGQAVAIDGKLHLDRWKTQNGENRQSVVINADFIRLLGTRKPVTVDTAQQAVNQATNSSADFVTDNKAYDQSDFDDDIPW